MVQELHKAWWIPPSLKNAEFSKLLIELGFVSEAKETAMIYDINDAQRLHAKTNLSIVQVNDVKKLNDFINILESYDNTCRSFYEKAPLELSEKLFVGYIQENAVSIGILFQNEDASGIFTLITDEHSRCKGYGGDMLIHLIEFAKTSKNNYVTLSASSDAGLSLYEKLGFKQMGRFECFEYTT